MYSVHELINIPFTFILSLIVLPDLLKIIILVFLSLIFKFHFSVYFPSLCKLSLKPCSFSDSISKSSAYMRQLMSFPYTLTGKHLSLSNCSKISLTKILNSRGLRLHPCLTPTKDLKKGVMPSDSLTASLISVYIDWIR